MSAGAPVHRRLATAVAPLGKGPRAWALPFAVTAAGYAALAVAGAVYEHTPIPFWDEWDGFLDGFMSLQHEGLAAYWHPHNEHRIVLARLLSWVDLRFFHGDGVFCLAANFLLAGGMALILCAALRRQLEAASPVRDIIALVVFALCFSWLQKENLAVPFQSQFFMASLLPFTAFYLLGVGGRAAFVGACAAGVASIGTMASGVLVLPLMAAMAVVLRAPRLRVAVLGTLAIACCVAYLQGYALPRDEGSPAMLLREPLAAARFVLVYLGAPFGVVAGNSQAVGAAMGALLVGLALFRAVQCFRSDRCRGVELALLFMLAAVSGTALLTAGGRLKLGIATALSRRYTTGSLFAWSSLLVLYAPALERLAGRRPWAFGTLAALPLLAFLPAQMRALRRDDDRQLGRRAAALALTMGVEDDTAFGLLYPVPERLLEVAGRARAQRLSFFGTWPFDVVPDRLGGRIDPTGPPCSGRVEAVSELTGTSEAIEIEGFLVDERSGAAPRFIEIAGEDGTIAGFAIGGGRDGAFRGYGSRSLLVGKVTLAGLRPGCAMRDVGLPAGGLPAKPALAFYRVRHRMDDESRVAGLAAVTGQNGWTGADFDRTSERGSRVFGTYGDAGDAGTGAIRLRLRKGQVVYYCSGPTRGQQRISIDDGAIYQGVLPLATDWVALDFSGRDLPGQFEVVLEDRGTSWGEWSAIRLAAP